MSAEDPRPPVPTILLVDDHPAFRMGVRQFLEASRRYQIVGECGDGETGLERLCTLQPDWALVDLAMPGLSGFALLEKVRQANIPTRILVYSMYAEAAYAERARRAGACGFIAKEDALTEIESALALPPGAFFQSRAVGRSFGADLDSEDSELLARLTDAEARICSLLGGGLTSKEIARELDVSPRTVQAHRRNISEKLDLHGPNRLLEFAVRNHRQLSRRM